LNSLDGFPTSATAAATFDGVLDGTSVGATTVRVYDVSANHMPVTTSTIVYTDVDLGEAKGQISVSAPTGGWIPGHTYAVALIAGETGLKGAMSGKAVVGSPTWTTASLEQAAG